jgi:hypothetical protein
MSAQPVSIICNGYWYQQYLRIGCFDIEQPRFFCLYNYVMKTLDLKIYWDIIPK